MHKGVEAFIVLLVVAGVTVGLYFLIKSGTTKSPTDPGQPSKYASVCSTGWINAVQSAHAEKYYLLGFKNSDGPESNQ